MGMQDDKNAIINMPSLYGYIFIYFILQSLQKFALTQVNTKEKNSYA